MNCIISIPQEAYDLITGKIDTANLDLYSTLIQSVKNGISFDDIENEIKKEMLGLISFSHSTPDYVNGIMNCVDIINNYGGNNE